MDSLILNVVIESAIIFIPSFFCFRNRHEFAKCFYSFLFVESFSRWQNAYKKHVQRSLRFTVYFVIVLFASAVNFIFGSSLTEINLFEDPVIAAFKLVNNYSDLFFLIFRFS